MGFIYKVTNNINGRIYIGQTSQTIQKRWQQHVYQAFLPVEPYNSALHRAMKKYGEDAFSVVEIEQCDDADLDEREIYWIDFYDSYANGYNLDLGGSGSRRCEDKEVKELWDAGYTAGQIADKLEFNVSTISTHLRAIGITTKESAQRGAQSANRFRVKPVYQYDIDGNYIGEFSSVQEAEKIIGEKIKTNAKYKLYGGYQWRRFKTDKIDSVRKILNTQKRPRKDKPKPVVHTPKINQPKKCSAKKVYQYSLDGEYLCEYNSISDAAKSTYTENSSIRYACIGKLKQTGGYQWRYEKSDYVSPVDMKKIIIEKMVHQYGFDGKYIQSFINSTEAAEHLNCNSRSIRKACDGSLHQTQGYQWRYEKYDCIPPIDKKAKSSEPLKVYQYDMDGNYIQSFNSAQDAASIFGEQNQNKIRRVCREEVTQAYGFKWRYYKVDKL